MVITFFLLPSQCKKPKINASELPLQKYEETTKITILKTICKFNYKRIWAMVSIWKSRILYGKTSKMTMLVSVGKCG